MLSGKGPRVHFEILPVGTVKTGFVTEFESAGINQTRHKISLEATASVRIVVPSGARTVSVTTTALMAESILVGDVARLLHPGRRGRRRAQLRAVIAC